MSIKKVSDAALKKWVDGLIAKKSVIGIQARGDRFAFGPLEKAADLRLDYDVSILPPKEYLQPPRETLLSFEKSSGYSSVTDDRPFVLFGVHPYDMAAISQMDEIFREGQPDCHYLARRENTVIVAVDAQTPSRNVFAGYMGTAHVENGFDVLLTRVGSDYLVETGTKKGEALTAALQREPDADSDAIEKRKHIWKKNDQALRQHELKADPASWPALLDASYDHPLWEDRAKRCFSCGSCTLTCPTCYCFDVRDEVDWSLQSGTRVRVWDGCMLAGFAAVAGGHNFRKNKAERFRHRYYRKGKYVPSKIGGRIACVGCGRCITACVAAIANPVEVFNTLKEEMR